MNGTEIISGAPDASRYGRRWQHHRQPRHSRCVYLQFVHSQAKTVSVAGSFNDWRPAVTPMIPMGSGWWVKGLVLPPGRYEYRLVVDGQWMPDPNAAELAESPYGGVNSVLLVPSDAVDGQPK